MMFLVNTLNVELMSQCAFIVFFSKFKLNSFYLLETEANNRCFKTCRGYSFLLFFLPIHLDN